MSRDHDPAEKAIATPIGAQPAFRLAVYVDHEHVPAERAQKPGTVEPHTITTKGAFRRQLHVFGHIRRVQVRTTVVVAVVDPRCGVRLHRSRYALLMSGGNKAFAEHIGVLRIAILPQ